MKLMSRSLMAIVAALATLGSLPLCAAKPASPRAVLSADAGWRFTLDDPKGAEADSFTDSAWRTVDLPHDWSIEGKPEKDAPGGAGEGFFQGGIGWYRKAFSAPAAWSGKRVSIEFDGVYRDATVYLNGQKLGTHPYGYTAFAMDMTPALNVAGRNMLAVRVDNSAQPNSRWYSGSGIYRHVRVVVTDPIHIAHWGVFVTTPAATASSAKVAVHARVANETAAQSTVTLTTTLFDKAGKSVGEARSTLSVEANAEAEAAQEIAVNHPALWSPDGPKLYRAVTEVRQGGKVVDETTTTFGIRTLEWSAEKGLLLSGKPVKLTGGSVTTTMVRWAPRRLTVRKSGVWNC